MKKDRLKTAFLLAAVLALTACTQDELTDTAGNLPEGKYPLQIGSVTLSVEGSEQPWGAKSPQTRVSENTDGNSSHFDNGDQIGVSFGGKTATYTYDGSTWTSDTPLYWENTQSATVTAWYPVGSEVDLTQQDQGLAYMMNGQAADVTYNTPADITLNHLLAKARVVLTGSKAKEVSKVTIYSYPKGMRDVNGALTGSGTQAYYPMRKANYNGTECWEANVVPGTLTAANSFQVAKDGGDPVSVTLASDVTLAAGTVNTITINVKNPFVPDDAKPITGEISDNGNYVVTGSRNETITVTSGSPSIYLDDAAVSVGSGNGINITGGTPTIHVVGGNNSVTSGNGAGIFVASGSTVTITGNGREDVLTTQAGGDAAGIGGCGNEQDCGNINISKVTVIARGSNYTYCSPGIGSTQTNKCGDITIDNATVHAYGTGVSNTCACPGIGAGLDISGSTGTTSPNVTIKNNSEVHAHRGNGYADYIGISYFMTSGGGQVRATIDQTSVVMKYTGDGNTPDQ